MRRIVCTAHPIQPAHPEDVARGLRTRYVNGHLRVDCFCDLCGKDLNKGDLVRAETCPADNIGAWEPEYIQ
jgi:hypothetical protein